MQKLHHTYTSVQVQKLLTVVPFLGESLNDIWIFMPTDLLADWFQQPYVHVEMKSSNFLLGL